MSRRIRLIALSVALLLSLPIACTDEGEQTFQLVITEPEPIQLDGDVVDSVELEGFDSAGSLIYGPERVAFGLEMTFDRVPEAVDRVQLDYLRNGGFALYRAEAGVATSARLDDPAEVAVDPHMTQFSIVENSGAFSVMRVRVGSSVSTDDDRLGPDTEIDGKPLLLKGVCYAPAPINFYNNQAPAVGDLFWDSFETGGGTLYNWYSLWGHGSLGGGHTARNDLGAIRGLGANTIRVYSMVSRQLNVDGSIPAPLSGHHFTHQQFLDLAWNNGNDPIYVLVDIPMPAAAFQRGLVPEPGQIEFWEATLEETVTDLRNHPAVLGFNFFNEHDSAPDSFPNLGQGPDDENTEFFYEQVIRYADLIKSIAPDKLVGWALHDVPDFVKFASEYPDPGPTYMEQLSSFDFWGINTYQTINLDSIFGAGFPGSYGDLEGAHRKPVLFTEFGWPATGHDPDQPDGALYEDAATRAATAEVVRRMYTKAFEQPLLLGSYYFEFSDEWWKQAPNVASQWNPGAPAPGFPNGYWDEEGFGLFASSVQGRAPTDSPWAGSGPRLPQDRLTPRTEIIEALREVYASFD